MAFHNGIIEDFEPKFTSIAKDAGRYFDALIDLSDQGIIAVGDVNEYSGKGSFWICCQYIEKGLIDMVEADMKRDLTSRDFYGPLFENQQNLMKYLLGMGENQRVLSLYQAAITHRLKAMKSESRIVMKFAPDSQQHKLSMKWIKHYLPALKAIIAEYEEQLTAAKQSDAEMENIQKAVREYDLLCDAERRD